MPHSARPIPWRPRQACWGRCAPTRAPAGKAAAGWSSTSGRSGRGAASCVTFSAGARSPEATGARCRSAARRWTPRCARRARADRRGVGAAWRRHADASDMAAELWAGATPADRNPPARRGRGGLRGAPAARGPRAKTVLLADAPADGRPRDPRLRQGDARRGADRRAGADAGGRRRPRDRSADRGRARREPSSGRSGGGGARRAPRPPRARAVRVLHARRPDARPAGRGHGGRGPAPRHAALGRGQVRRRPVPAPQGRRGRAALLAGSRDLTRQFPELVAAFSAAPGATCSTARSSRWTAAGPYPSPASSSGSGGSRPRPRSWRPIRWRSSPSTAWPATRRACWTRRSGLAGPARRAAAAPGQAPAPMAATSAEELKRSSPRRRRAATRG